MRSAIRGWFRPITLVRVMTSIVDMEAKQARVEQECSGLVQPFGAQQLRLKPEGERSWNWVMLHVTPDVVLRNGEEFEIRGTRYRVMSNNGWSDFGYISYELVEGYREP